MMRKDHREREKKIREEAITDESLEVEDHVPMVQR